MLCGPLGYEDFMRPDWIKMVMAWPDKRLGCFRSDLYKELQEILQEETTSSLPEADKTKDKDIMRALYQHR